MSELWQLTLQEAAQGLGSQQFTSVELTRSCLERIEQVEDRIKSYVTVVAVLALEQAAAADQRLAQGITSKSPA